MPSSSWNSAPCHSSSLGVREFQSVALCMVLCMLLCSLFVNSKSIFRVPSRGVSTIAFSKDPTQFFGGKFVWAFFEGILPIFFTLSGVFPVPCGFSWQTNCTMPNRGVGPAATAQGTPWLRPGLPSPRPIPASPTPPIEGAS